MAKDMKERTEPDYYSTRVGKNARGKELGAPAPDSMTGVPDKGIKGQKPVPSKKRYAK